jgi:hypothetical protein
MKVAIGIALALMASASTGYTQTQDLINFIGGIVDDVLESDPPQASKRGSYPARRPGPEAGSYARRVGASGGEKSAARGAWAVVSLNGATIAAEPNGVSVSHNTAGHLYLSIATKSPISVGAPNVAVSFSFNGENIGSFQAKNQGSSIIIDDPNALVTLLSSFKVKRNYEIGVVDIKIAGTLTGAGKAIEEVERAARSAQVAGSSVEASAALPNSVGSDAVQRSFAANGAAPGSAAGAHAGSGAANSATANNGVGSVAALSDGDKEALEKTADGVANLTAQIEMLRKVLENQQGALQKANIDQKLTIEATIKIVNARIEEKKNDLKQADVKLQGYLTSITPNNRNQYLSARKASEMYPKVPFYIPGTTETGEFWVEPFVTDKGEQRFKFHFIDREAHNDVKRDTIEMDRGQLFEVQQGLFKLFEWSKKAQEEKIRRVFSKRAICFPLNECPADGEKGELGRSSTEVRFQIYEDGATAGRIQRNKGRFEEGYNISIDSAMLLQAYAAFVLKESDFDFKAGSQSIKDLDEMFQ